MTLEEMREACAEVAGRRARRCTSVKVFIARSIAAEIRALEIPEEDRRVDEARKELADAALAYWKKPFFADFKIQAREYDEALKAVEAAEENKP